ncbi:MAG: hypothetical protein KJO07_08505 [Deltaproteobacteria bacterium]|nr:hypothetical protein [Deltaproteobacteria bacterium]
MLQNLSEIVLEEGLATREEMRKAAREADEAGRPLIAALVDVADIDQRALVAALSKYTKAEIAEPHDLEIDIEAVRQVSQEICGRLKVMPVSISPPGENQVLTLAVADPTDAVGMAEIEHVYGCGVQPVLLPLDEVEKLIHRYYRELVTEVMPRKRAPFGGGGPDDGRTSPTTQPHHRIAAEAGTAVRLEALIKLLEDKRVFTEEELDEAVRAVLKGHTEPA